MISIIIPTYNRSGLLREAVESCLFQSFQNIEILIIDDGSTDDTEKIVNKLLEREWKNRDIIYCRQQNSGASAARNKGLKLAKGEYIQFLDSDDLLFPEKIEYQLNSIMENDSDGCSCLGLMGETPDLSTTILGEKFDSVPDLMHRMCSGRVHVMCTPAPLWKKSALLKSNGWNSEIAFGDDLEYHIRVLIDVQKMAFVSEKLFFVREHKDNRLSNASMNIKQIESGIKTQQLIAENIHKNGLWDEEFQRGIIKNCRTLYANYLKLADKSKLIEFEKWMICTSTKGYIQFKIIFIIAFRILLGAKSILYLYNKN